MRDLDPRRAHVERMATSASAVPQESDRLIESQMIPATPQVLRRTLRIETLSRDASLLPWSRQTQFIAVELCTGAVGKSSMRASARPATTPRLEPGSTA